MEEGGFQKETDEPRNGQKKHLVSFLVPGKPSVPFLRQLWLVLGIKLMKLTATCFPGSGFQNLFLCSPLFGEDSRFD